MSAWGRGDGRGSGFSAWRNCTANLSRQKPFLSCLLSTSTRALASSCQSVTRELIARDS